MLIYLLLILIAFSTALLVTPVVRTLALRFGAVDNPGVRKIHTVAVPRLGGISVVLAVLIAIVAAQSLGRLNPGFPLALESWRPILLGGIVVFFIGLWDDLRPLPAWLKFLFQGVAAGVAIWSDIRIEHVSALGGGGFNLGILTIPITFLWIVGLTNAFNLIDGLDGLAAGVGLIAASTIAITFLIVGEASGSLLLLILAGSLAGFLRYNFYPASIFLGDSGSQFIGYVLAVAAVTEIQNAKTALPALILLLVFGLPIFDTLLSMIRRAFKSNGGGRLRQGVRRESILSVKQMFLPDRDHVHHRLLTLGFTHRSAVLSLYALATGLSALALISGGAAYRNAGAILLTVIIAMYVGLQKLGYQEVAFLRSATALRWCKRFMFTRLSFVTIVDWILIATAYWAAFLMKYDGLWIPEVAKWYLIAFPVVFIIQMSVLFSLGLYLGIIRLMGIADVLGLSFATGLAVLLSYVVSAIFEPPPGILTFFGINWLLLQVMLLGGRGAYKILGHLDRRDRIMEGGPILIYGAGRRGEWILQELMENRGLGFYPIGFLDDDPYLIGSSINRVRVLGGGKDLASILNSRKVSAFIISSHKITSEHLVPLINLCSKRRIPVLRGAFHLDRLLSVALSSTRDEAQKKDVAPASQHAFSDPSTVKIRR